MGGGLRRALQLPAEHKQLIGDGVRLHHGRRLCGRAVAGEATQFGKRHRQIVRALGARAPIAAPPCPPGR